MAKRGIKSKDGFSVINGWLESKGLRAFDFQKEAWEAYANGASGLVNAPTGFGKTFSIFLAAVIDFINRHPDDCQNKRKNALQLLWVTPLRALAKDIHRAMEAALSELAIPWRVGGQKWRHKHLRAGFAKEKRT